MTYIVYYFLHKEGAEGLEVCNYSLCKARVINAFLSLHLFLSLTHSSFLLFSTSNPGGNDGNGFDYIFITYWQHPIYVWIKLRTYDYQNDCS